MGGGRGGGRWPTIGENKLIIQSQMTSLFFCGNDLGIAMSSGQSLHLRFVSISLSERRTRFVGCSLIMTYDPAAAEAAVQRVTARECADQSC